MRLIDADALMKALGIEEHCDDCQYHHHEVYCKRSCDFVTACEAISDAPTIEPEQRSFSCGQENDAISRKAAVDALGKEGLITAMVIVDRLPSAQPEQRAHGHWVHRGCGVFECDQCGKLISTNVYKAEKASDSFKFCPECGAGMRGEQDA